MKRAKIILFLVFLISLSAYAQKKKKKDEPYSFAGRTYHNTTARYNGYFNARMLMKENLATIQEEVETDYDKLLEFYPSVNEQKAQGITPDMDIIIEKTNKVIDKHLKSKWVDDCYLLMAKAYFLKGDHEKAIESIHFITSEYHHNKELEAKRKKKKKKKKRYKRPKPGQKRGQEPEKPFVEALLEKHKITHQPVYYEAIILLIQIYLKQENFYKAEAVYEFVRNDQDVPEYVKDDMKLIQAHLYIQKEEYQKAIRPLQETIAITNQKKTKSKYTYVLAQLHQLTGNNKQAISEYKNVLKLNPDYELAFNAKLSIAKTFEKRAGISYKQVMQELESLAKDEKNSDYLDEIYYMMGMISLQQGREEYAMKHFKNSISASTVNAKQKGKSYLAIGKLHYENSNYDAAHVYYDSAMTYLPTDIEGIQEEKEIADNLSAYHTQSNIIYTEDSLQRLALLPEAELDEFIDNLIDMKIEELEEAQAQKELEEANLANQKTNTGLRTVNTSRKVKFYFYEESIRTKGMQTFINKWGNRKLEDDWRRKDKTSSNGDGGDQEEVDEYAIAEESILDREQYYQNIPLTPEKLKASNTKMEAAHLKLAVIYKDDIENQNEAIDILLSYIDRFPKGDYLLEAYYYLYLLYGETNKPDKAKIYKDLILRKYPNSEIAKVIKGTRKDSSNINNDESSYASVFDLYHSKQYQEAITAAEQLKQTDSENSYIVKVLLIEAMAYGQLSRFDDMIPKLESIIENYPSSREAKRADGILNAISNKQKIQKSQDDPTSIYVFRPNEKHYYCVSLDNELARSNNVSVLLSNFNLKMHRLEEYKISTLNLGDEYTLVSVKSFKDMEAANTYLKTIKNEKSLFENIPPTQLRSFVISDNNFKKLMKLVKLEEYMEFFENYYEGE